MVILDIDLDFFLDSIIHNPRTRRPSNSRVKPWDEKRVINFLEKKCNLNKQRKIKGKIFKTHDKLFYCFRDLINKRKLSVPFEIVHVDAHADLGIGTLSDKYIMTELLYRPVNERTKPKRGGWEGLSESNFLAFVIACRWIDKLVYVHHREIVRSNVDITESVKKDFDFYSDFIQFKKVSPEECEKKHLDIRRCTILELEPEVPIELVDENSFCTQKIFDYIFLTHSPKYTPKGADKLISLILNYINTDYII